MAAASSFMAGSRDRIRGRALDPGLRLDRVRIRLDRLRGRRLALDHIRRARRHRLRRTGAAGGMSIRSRQRSPLG